jgi:hypothetical protein
MNPLLPLAQNDAEFARAVSPPTAAGPGSRTPAGVTGFYAAVVLAGLFTQLAVPAQAQTAAPAKPQAAAKPAPKPAPAARKPAAPAALPPATGEQLAAASMTHFGDYECDFSQKLKVGLNAKNDGYVDVRLGKQAWTMKPVLSSTGALRLEDVKGRMLLLQIANKSMLMDTQAGRRVVDDCVHEKQQESNRTSKATSEPTKP